jgi:hypothetical protein
MEKPDIAKDPENDLPASPDLLGKLGKFALPILFLFLIGNAIDTVLKLVDAAKHSRFAFATTLFVFLSMFFYRYYQREKILAGRKQIIVLRFLYLIAVIAYLTTVAFPYARVYLFDYGPAPQSPVKLSALRLIPLAHAGGPPIEIVALYVDEDRSSFEDVSELDQSAPPTSGKRIRTFQYNQRVDSARKRGDCVGVQGDQPIQRVLPLLAARLRAKNLHDLAPYVESLSGYRRLMSAGGEKFLDVLFTQEEVSRLRTDDPTNFAQVAAWLVDCVGVTEPILTLIIRNNTNAATVISKSSYLVDQIVVVLGGAKGPAVPEYTYRHAIPHAVGVPVRQLNPPFIVDAHSVGTFSVALNHEGSGPGRTWLMRIRIGTVDGPEATSERFQLILSK